MLSGPATSSCQSSNEVSDHVHEFLHAQSLSRLEKLHFQYEIGHHSGVTAKGTVVCQASDPGGVQPTQEYCF